MIAAAIGAVGVVSRLVPHLPNVGDPDVVAPWLVRKEIAEDPRCLCAPPVTVLHVDAAGIRWVGDPGKCR